MAQYGNRINRCRPGHGASCALCCGSHNYTLGPEEIGDLLLERGRDLSTFRPGHPEESVCEKPFPDAMQCPNLGMDPSEPGVLCCLVYDLTDRETSLESFFTGTCKTFYCPAWDELTDRQVLFAARLMKDWYYYGLFINHIEAVQDFCARYDAPEDVPDDELEALREELVDVFVDEDGK